MPVLTPGSSPLRVLHLSDFHMRPQQRRKQAWLRDLARWDPDLVVNTGDNLAHPKAVPAVVQAMGDLLSVPGLFVFGSNDYFGPTPKNPTNYVFKPSRRVTGEPLPWQDLRAAFTERGWLDMTHTRREIEVNGQLIAAGGRRRPASVPRPLRHHRGTPQPGGQPDAGPGARAVHPGARPLRRRRLPAGDGRTHPWRTAVRAVAWRHRHQLRSRSVAGQGRVPVGRRHAAARVAQASAPRRTHRSGSAAGRRPRC